MRRILLALIILMLAIAPAYGEKWSGKCVKVADGDTITVQQDTKKVRIRLYGIDCPEGKQDFSKEAKQFTTRMVLDKIVEVEQVDYDNKYRRPVAWITVEGTSLNRELLKAGLAWWYRKYAPTHTDLKQLEAQARNDKIGLWSQPNPVAPWCFRHPEQCKEQVGDLLAPVIYHGNSSSKVFHAPNCRDYDCKKCTVELPTKAAAFKAGYKPCGNCCKALLKEFKSGKTRKPQ